MDSEQIQWTLDLILGQLGTVTQQIRETQGELVDFRRQAGERLDNTERLENPAIYTPPLDLTLPMGTRFTLNSELDSGFEFDEDGRTDILGSPFFDVFFGADETADEYLDRILYRLSLALEEHITPGRWIIIGHPPPPPPPAIFPSPRILSATVLVVMSLLAYILRPHLLQACMADPEIDHIFVFDEQGRTDILRSPFFDVTHPSGPLGNRRSPLLPPPPATSPSTKVFGSIFLVVISFLVWSVFSR
ncbi:hypothetical protein M5K25_025797 [Dendrobium thyrsiflorum]|uniref:Uncharacterized protein n=1 Tax=Dendrobium thyrsiflorum TaxID=117978 RepID=A0ABD0U4X8_DENTH